MTKINAFCWKLFNAGKFFLKETIGNLTYVYVYFDKWSGTRYTFNELGEIIAVDPFQK